MGTDVQPLQSVKSGILAVPTDTGGPENWRNRWTLMNMINDDNDGLLCCLYVLFLILVYIDHVVMGLIMLPWYLLFNYEHAIHY